MLVPERQPDVERSPVNGPSGSHRHGEMSERSVTPGRLWGGLGRYYAGPSTRESLVSLSKTTCGGKHYGR
jgi:hypothetical protein